MSKKSISGAAPLAPRTGSQPVVWPSLHAQPRQLCPDPPPVSGYGVLEAWRHTGPVQRHAIAIAIAVRQATCRCHTCGRGWRADGGDCAESRRCDGSVGHPDAPAADGRLCGRRGRRLLQEEGGGRTRRTAQRLLLEEQQLEEEERRAGRTIYVFVWYVAPKLELIEHLRTMHVPVLFMH